MYKIFTTFLCSIFACLIFISVNSVKADDCVAPVSMSCSYEETGDTTIVATVTVSYLVDGSTASDLSSVVFSDNCDATAVGVGVEVVDPTHDTNADDTNPCAEGDMKITVDDYDDFCTLATSATCSAGNIGAICSADTDCDTSDASGDGVCGDGICDATSTTATCSAGLVGIACSADVDCDDIGGDGVCGDSSCVAMLCVGGINDTQACASDVDCPDTLSSTCEGGSDDTLKICTVNDDCADTQTAASIECIKTIDEIDISACDEEIATIAESSNLHDRQVEDSKDCNGRRCKNDDDDKGHDRGTVLCTVPEV